MHLFLSNGLRIASRRPDEHSYLSGTRNHEELFVRPDRYPFSGADNCRVDEVPCEDRGEELIAVIIVGLAFGMGLQQVSEFHHEAGLYQKGDRRYGYRFLLNDGSAPVRLAVP
jgi:hypothetical protein